MLNAFCETLTVLHSTSRKHHDNSVDCDDLRLLTTSYGSDLVLFAKKVDGCLIVLAEERRVVDRPRCQLSPCVENSVSEKLSFFG